MGRFLALSFLVVLAACMPTHMRTQTPHTSSAADLERKTVALVVVRGDEARAYCSGVWVAYDEILTANHCVDDSDLNDRLAYVTRGDLLAQSGDEVEAVRLATLVARDEDHDLALLRVKLPPQHDTAMVASESPFVGEATQTMGHPMGLWWSYSTGEVAAIRVVNFDDRVAMWWVQSTAPISPGNSGGGLFNSNGELLGIAHAYMPRGENVNLYIHSTYLRDFLKANS